LLQDGDRPPLVAELAERSAAFVGASHAGLRAAAERVGGVGGGVAFADPGFGADNATFAPQSLLWGLTSENPIFARLNLGVDLFPEDPLQSVRLKACFEPQQASPLLNCLFASVGHPNRAGAARYADAIVAVLRELGLLAGE
jgi:hypothetical protein